MRYRVHVGRLPGGAYQATCLEPQCSAKGATAAEAVERVKGEIQYRLEFCPCSGLREGETIEVDVVGPRRT